MKEIESSRRDSVESKKLRRAKQLDRAKQLATPDSEPSAIDFERQLRKIATRGVVALFNAISKAKREAATEVSAKKDAGIKKDVQVPTIETQLRGIKRLVVLSNLQSMTFDIIFNILLVAPVSIYL